MVKTTGSTGQNHPKTTVQYDCHRYSAAPFGYYVVSSKVVPKGENMTDNLQHEALLAGFHSTWTLVQNGASHHIRLHLTNLRTARAVCQHIADELDHLIKLAEDKLKDYESLDRDIRGWQKACTGELACRS
jgi:hypothetical protein